MVYNCVSNRSQFKLVKIIFQIVILKNLDLPQGSVLG